MGVASSQFCVPGIQCLDRLKMFWAPTRRHKPTISSPLPIDSDGSDEHHESFDNESLRHSTGPGFQIMSDLHLEGGGVESQNSYERFVITPNAPYLILSGDIGCFKDKDRYLGFLRRQCDSFVRVFLIPGNHEYYGLSRTEGLKVAAEMQNCLDGLTVMEGNGRRVDVDDDTILLGCTLYSSGNPDKAAFVNDFHYIVDWSPEKQADVHEADKTFLETALKDIMDTKPYSRVVIATHYAPLYGPALQPKHRKSPLNGFFCSNTLDDLFDKALLAQVDVWIFGHTHYNVHKKIRHVQVLSNQFRDMFSKRKFRIGATV